MTTTEIKVQPLGSRILIRPDGEGESRTDAGIFIPETAKEKPQTGIVAAVGDEEDDIKVEIGQKVLFPKYTGTEIRMDGVDYLIMDADDVLAILKD